MEGVRSEPNLRGIIPNSFAHIFGFISKLDGDTKYVYLLIHYNCKQSILQKNDIA